MFTLPFLYDPNLNLTPNLNLSPYPDLHLTAIPTLIYISKLSIARVDKGLGGGWMLSYFPFINYNKMLKKGRQREREQRLRLG